MDAQVNEKKPSSRNHLFFSQNKKQWKIFINHIDFATAHQGNLSLRTITTTTKPESMVIQVVFSMKCDYYFFFEFVELFGVAEKNCISSLPRHKNVD